MARGPQVRFNSRVQYGVFHSPDHRPLTGILSGISRMGGGSNARILQCGAFEKAEPSRLALQERRKADEQPQPPLRIGFKRIASHFGARLPTISTRCEKLQTTACVDCKRHWPVFQLKTPEILKD